MYTYTSSTYTQHSPPGGARSSGSGVPALRHSQFSIFNSQLNTDHLGSITAVTSQYTTKPKKYSYDAWGRRRNATTWASYTLSTAPIFARGYTGHEHIDVLGIINMNGRMYDSRLGLFLSPDPYLQAPGNALNYNRYSYCVNNPLKYNDPSGEFFLGTILTFITENLKLVGKFYQAYAVSFSDPSKAGRMINDALVDYDPTAQWSRINKAYRIDAGRFQTSGDNVFERGWQLFRRNTWESLQYKVGNTIAHFANLTGTVREVNYFRGATVVDTDLFSNPFSTSPYIFGEDFRLSHGNYYQDHTFVHEYGHFIQSKYLGPMYFRLVAFPSMLSVGLRNVNVGTHQNRWFEALASRYGGRYFNEHYSQFELNSYQTGNISTYANPRDGNSNWRGRRNAFDGIEQFDTSDLFLYNSFPYSLYYFWNWLNR